MRNKKQRYRRISFLFFFLAISLLGFNTYRSAQAERLSKEILDQLKQEQEGNKKFSSLEEGQEYLTKEINGVEIIGTLSIPKMDKILPVTLNWSQELMNKYPNKYMGKSYNEPLIIMAHNYRSQFGGLNRLKEGDQVTFTDVVGRKKVFEVDGKEVIGAREVEEMTETNYPLTLFTCTLDRQSRLTVRFTEVNQFP